MALRWRDIDFERGVGILHDTKNGERRAIAIRASHSRSYTNAPECGPPP
ncbi:MAG: hypothetical protein GY719_31500 [bacterium]|nr:hypothetical protein [bacterium]